MNSAFQSSHQEFQILDQLSVIFAFDLLLREFQSLHQLRMAFASDLLLRDFEGLHQLMRVEFVLLRAARSLSIEAQIQ